MCVQLSPVLLNVAGAGCGVVLVVACVLIPRARAEKYFVHRMLEIENMKTEMRKVIELEHVLTLNHYVLVSTNDHKPESTPLSANYQDLFHYTQSLYSLSVSAHRLIHKNNTS